MARLLSSATPFIGASAAWCATSRRFASQRSSSSFMGGGRTLMMMRRGSAGGPSFPSNHLCIASTAACTTALPHAYQTRFAGCPFSGAPSTSAKASAAPASAVEGQEEEVKPVYSGGGCPFSGGASSKSSASATSAAASADGGGCPMSVSKLPKGMCPVEDGQHVPTLSATLNVLGKGKLSAFVSATAVAGYVLAGGTSPLVALAVGLGTQLQSMSACTANQICEVPYDSLMKRTAKRPLVAKEITKDMAVTACVAEGVAGSALLAIFSPQAAALGALNWFLYVGMYTPLKRISAVNTWFGAIIGGIPPLMGGAAAVGGSLAFTPAIGPAYLLAAYMLVWQIPHFMALSFHCRRDYESAGFKMLAFKHPVRASLYAILLSVIMVAVTLVGPTVIGWETELWYYPVTAVPGAIMVQKSVLFHQDPIRHCRGCFLFSYAYLGAVLLALTLNHLQPIHQLTAAYNWLQNGSAHNNNSTNSISSNSSSGSCSSSGTKKAPSGVVCDGNSCKLVVAAMDEATK